MALETEEPHKEWVAPIGIGDLVRNCLHMAPDRILVGEMCGDEAFFLIRALSSGYGGGFGTLPTARRPFGFEAAPGPDGPVSGLNIMVIAEMVGEAIDVVLHQAFDEKDGKRRVSEVIEVEKPGAVIHPSGSVGYAFYSLVAWAQVGASRPVSGPVCSQGREGTLSRSVPSLSGSTRGR